MTSLSCPTVINRFNKETSQKHHTTIASMELTRKRRRGRETPGRETPKTKERIFDTQGEKWRKWPQTDKIGGPWSIMVNRRVSDNQGFICKSGSLGKTRTCKSEGLRKQNITKRILSMTITTMFYYHQSPTVQI